MRWVARVQSHPFLVTFDLVFSPDCARYAGPTDARRAHRYARGAAPKSALQGSKVHDPRARMWSSNIGALEVIGPAFKLTPTAPDLGAATRPQ